MAGCGIGLGRTQYILFQVFFFSLSLMLDKLFFNISVNFSENNSLIFNDIKAAMLRVYIYECVKGWAWGGGMSSLSALSRFTSWFLGLLPLKLVGGWGLGLRRAHHILVWMWIKGDMCDFFPLFLAMFYDK